MSPVTPTDSQGTSTRPYLIRALHDWCTDNGFTPYLAVYVDGSVQVPNEYVKNNEIVLNVGFEATSGLQLGNDYISFKARFGGVAREILVPTDHVVAIYARENGQGMAFPVPQGESASTPGQPADVSPARKPGGGLRLASEATAAEAEAVDDAVDKDGGNGDDEPSPPPRPALKRVK